MGKAFTQIFVVRSQVEDEESDPALELRSREDLLDILVVTDHYGGEGTEIEPQDLGVVLLRHLVTRDVCELVALEQQEPITAPQRQAGWT
jgi:hypothetical protein